MDPWKRLGPFPNALDFYNDGSLYIIDSPGHLQGHITALIRIGPGKWLYLAGDSCHHPDLLSGRRRIAQWETSSGCACVHACLPATEEHLTRVRSLARLHQDEVEVILAHDKGWRDRNGSRFLPGHL